MDIRKQLIKHSNERTYHEQLEYDVLKKQAQEYYINTFEQKIYDAAQQSENSNECSFEATADDLKYFDFLRQICGRNKIFVYESEDETEIVVRWNNK